MSTPNLGLYTVPTTSPDYEGGLSPVSQLSSNFTTLDGKSAVEVEAASGAIGITQGASVITKSSGVAAMTLAGPTAGLPSAAGHDGQILRIVSTTAQAHTVTTPTNKINGAKHILTYTGVGDFAELLAYGGVWYLLAASAGVALS